MTKNIFHSFKSKNSHARFKEYTWMYIEYVVLILLLVTTILFTLVTSTADKSKSIIAIFLLLAVFVFIQLYYFRKLATEQKQRLEFLSVATHQLHTPVSELRWTIELLERRLVREKASPDTKHSVESLHELADKLSHTINTFLGVQRIEEDMLTLSRQSFSLRDVTNRELRVFRRFAEASNVSITLDAENNVKDVIGDQNYTAIVIQHLIYNAIHFSNKEKGKIIIQIANQNNQFVRWSISDNGAGIPRALQQKVFDKYFRADSDPEQRAKASGIGLFISQFIIKHSEGEIGVSSKIGEGSTFWFTLPVAL